ncbi:unnamed protein product [Sphagnum compactum]
MAPAVLSYSSGQVELLQCPANVSIPAASSRYSEPVIVAPVVNSSSSTFSDGSEHRSVLSSWQALELQLSARVAENAASGSTSVAKNSSFAQSDQEVISSSVNGSASSLQLGRSRSFSASDQQKLLGSTMTSGDWQQLLDSASNRTSFRSSTSGNLAVPASTGQQQMLNSSVQADAGMESLGGPGHSCTSRFVTGDSSLRAAGRAAGRGGGSVGHSAIFDSKLVLSTAACSRRWNSLEQASCGISVEPTKGALALQGVGLATSHCLEQFSSDPAFAERAAKYSSFGNAGTYSSSQMISQPLPFMDSERSRAAARVGNVSRAPQPESERKISRASSFPPSGVKLNVAASSSRSHKVESVINNPLQQDTHEAAEQRQDDHAQDPDQVQPGARSTGDQELPGAAYSGAGNQLEDEEARIIDAAGATDNDNMDHVSKAGQETTSREEDFSCTADQEHAAACRSVESSDDTGNKRKIEIQYSDAGKETNTGYFTDSKADQRSSSENSGDSGASPCRGRNDLLTMQKENVQPMSISSEPLAASCKLQDYVHVRARRGQATDSHSLAERVRREKISERMKYLQDLVPGCSKVTGKAVMLDEIINYVQSLQRQVEFLSMKLASVNPRLDYNLDCIFNKEMLQSGASSIVGPEPSSTYGLHLPLTPADIANGLEFQSLGTMDSCHLRRTISAPPTGVSSVPNLDTFGDDATQMSIEWDGELQSMLQMGFGQASGATSSLILEGFNNSGHMKVEL